MPKMWERRNKEGWKAQRKTAIQIFYEGNSGRAVGRIMGINKSTVYNWIKKLNKKTQKTEPT